MLKCEGLTIRQLRVEYGKNNNLKEVDDIKIDEAITDYLNLKPGTWSLRAFTANQFGFYFIWSVQ